MCIHNLFCNNQYSGISTTMARRFRFFEYKISIINFISNISLSIEYTDQEGYFGLFESCKYKHPNGLNQTQTDLDLVSFYPRYSRLVCEGTWTSIQTSVNPASTFFIGFSALITLLCIAMFLVLFLFVNPSIVFTICGVLQLISSNFL